LRRQIRGSKLGPEAGIAQWQERGQSPIEI
jgi:hypothetical protein